MAQKLTGYPVGEQLYIFCAGSRPDSAKTRDVVISAHGGFSRSTESFRLPKWVRGLYLYGPHGAVLMDPGVGALTTSIHAFEVKRGGDMVQNYTLSKYQGTHSGSGETYESLQRDLGRRALDMHEWETNRHRIEAFDRKKQTLGARIGEARKALVEKTKELKAAKTAAALPEAASDPGAEDFEPIRAAVIEDIQRQVAEMKRVMDERQTELDRFETTVRPLQNIKENVDRRARMHGDGTAGSTEVLALFDVLTIRNRRFRGDPTLKDVIDALYTAGLPYARIHCSFCRSPVWGDSRHEKEWTPAWNSSIKR